MEQTAAWKEIAQFLLDNVDDIGEELEASFVQEYPRARANVLDYEAIHGWTVDAIHEIADCLDSGDYSAYTYLNHTGDVLDDPYETELTLFASFLSSTLSITRHIAPMLMRSTYTKPAHGRELINALESFTQQVIALNCDLFKQETGAPRALSRGWRLLDGQRDRRIASDSPAKRRMTQERYSRIVKSTIEPAKPKGDALTPREQEVLVHITDGRSNAEIARIMGISEATVKKHVSHIFDKYNVFSRTELIARVRERRQ
ncbi:CsgBAC operon transcriptional regulatory protein [Slackia heliotrinireducens]|uniref:Response regulator containing a CheY-like receiver domain and an HTH DNA-binding domain n=1 Tax=Slackia heliotrinireducens (strain ATCC 29202 / DSM 20476 / NCTC 11029 / RHS 1) TaxID=471855 RepID=C7N7C7_SLAHD|nr:response regulator transcription factor [Slackia heliotrinireducens]ACV22812.1 response regulator containing a CheY-like receiver domain and an HTH DNA-binding domain [Slackia heliotrinireducens DSM 20476]VEH01526.1 CsgBAC operon transcriptional regulatory protein [Slackia heliotrinireducens]